MAKHFRNFTFRDACRREPLGTTSAEAVGWGFERGFLRCAGRNPLNPDCQGVLHFRFSARGGARCLTEKSCASHRRKGSHSACAEGLGFARPRNRNRLRRPCEPGATTCNIRGVLLIDLRFGWQIVTRAESNGPTYIWRVTIWLIANS